MMLKRMKMQELNPYIMCVLCGGYLVDATTIVECLHSFCRSCIVKYLHSSYQCPVCDVEVHKTRPLLNIRSDRTLQDIVYKLVPGLYYDELKRRQDVDTSQQSDIAASNCEETENNEIVNKDKTYEETDQEKAEIKMEDPVFLTLEYYRMKRNRFDNEIFPTRYLRCPSAVTVSVLKKFLVMKFAIPTTHQPEVIRCDEILEPHLTMKQVKQIYGLYAKSFLDLQYAFLDADFEEPGSYMVKRKRKIKTRHINPANKRRFLKMTNDTELCDAKESNNGLLRDVENGLDAVRYVHRRPTNSRDFQKTLKSLESFSTVQPIRLSPTAGQKVESSLC